MGGGPLTRVVENNFRWPLGVQPPKPAQLLAIYQAGFVGCHVDPAEDERLFSAGVLQTFSQACPHLRDLHKQADRQLAPLFLAREQLDPGAFGDEAQTTGDCVSHGDRNARDVSRSVEIVSKGEPEIYFARGATEPTYGYRGHGGQGMNPARATEFVTRYGMMFRVDYPGLVDLSRYDSSIGARWGRGGVPSAIREKCAEHPVGRYIVPESLEEACDLLAAGYACHSGQNVGFRSTPNSQGYHPIAGRWNHDMATLGMDLTKDVWPVPVVFVQNSWGDFNTQPTDRYQARNWPRIPGAIVARADDWWELFGTMYFYADVAGVPAKKLPDWGSHLYL